MAFPIIYDIVVVSAHMIVTFTPKVNRQDEILNTTDHPEFYQEYVYRTDLGIEDFAEVEWNAWTVWNCAQLILSAAEFLFYVYIIIAVIIDGIEGFGKFNPTSSLLN